MVAVLVDQAMAHSACSIVVEPGEEAVREGTGFPAYTFRGISAICLCTVLVLPW